MTLKDGTKVSDVFEVSKWKKVKESLSDEEILILANPKKTFNLEITKRLQELAGNVNERVNKIKKIAAARKNIACCFIECVIIKKFISVSTDYKKYSNIKLV